MLVTVGKRQSSMWVSTVAKRQNVGVGWYLQRELQSIEDRKMEEILIPTRSACTCLLLAFSVTASAVR